MPNFSTATMFDRFQDTRFPTNAAGVERGIFVDHLGNPAGNGARAEGISIDALTAADVTAKKGLPVGMDGSYPMVTSAAYALGVQLASDATGKPRLAVAGEFVNGIAEEASTAAGQVRRVRRVLYKI